MSSTNTNSLFEENNPHPRQQRRRQQPKKKGNDSISGHSIPRDIKLFRNFEALSQLFAIATVSSISSPKLIPISIRGIGFAIFTVWTMISNLITIPNTITIHHLYRSAIAQLTYRMTQLVQPTLLARRTDYRYINLSAEFATEIANHPVHLSAVTSIINMIGNFSIKDQDYFPMIPTLEERFGMFIHDITTYRGLVQLASNPATPVDTRTHLYETCSIPGSIWVLNNGARTLANPQDLIPRNYDIAMFREDNAVVNRLVQLIVQKHPRLVGRFVDTLTGSHAQFVSTDASNMRLVIDRDTVIENNRNVVRDGPATIQNQNEFKFRSIEYVPNVIFLLGAGSLIGECHAVQNVPVAMNQCIRTDSISAQDATLDPIAITRAMFE